MAVIWSNFNPIFISEIIRQGVKIVKASSYYNVLWIQRKRISIFLSMCRALGKYFVERASLYKQFYLNIYYKIMTSCKIQWFIPED